MLVFDSATNRTASCLSRCRKARPAPRCRLVTQKQGCILRERFDGSLSLIVKLVRKTVEVIVPKRG